MRSPQSGPGHTSIFKFSRVTGRESAPHWQSPLCLESREINLRLANGQRFCASKHQIPYLTATFSSRNRIVNDILSSLVIRIIRSYVQLTGVVKQNKLRPGGASAGVAARRG